jgi:hypothetical protein
MDRTRSLEITAVHRAAPSQTALKLLLELHGDAGLDRSPHPKPKQHVIIIQQAQNPILIKLARSDSNGSQIAFTLSRFASLML